MRSLCEDFRYAFRGLRKSPGFTAIATLLLALGTGANTAVFTVVHSVLLRPLPFPHAERLVRMARSRDAPDVTVPEYRFWKQYASSYQAAAAYRGTIDRTLDAGDTLEWVKVMPVTAGFFRTLSVAPALGREFTDEEAGRGGPQAIILTDSLWRNAFGGRANVVGSIVLVDNARCTVVGVLPPGFRFPGAADAFAPLRFLGALDDAGTNTSMIARLKPGIDLRQAEAERAPLTEAFLRTRPAYLTPRYRGVAPFPYQQWLSQEGDLRTTLLALLAAVFLLLVIACSNLAGLLLSRFASRRKEIAVRLALGSSSPRLLRQFLLENVLLGGLAGLLCAAWMLGGLLALMPFPQLPVSSPIRLNLTVLSCALAVAVGVNLLLSFMPLLASSRVGIMEALKSGHPQSGARQRMGGALVAGQAAISVTLSISAALLIQSLYRLHQEKLGFSPKGVMTLWTPTALGRRGKPEELKQFNAALLDRLRRLPGVRSAATANMLPLIGPSNFHTQREGHPEQTIGGMEIRAVTPDYFQTIGTRVLRGRAFTEEDKDGSAPVILVSESVASRWWGHASPIGDRVVIGLLQGRSLGNDPPRQVVGVVEDAQRKSLKEPSPPAVYVPLDQWGRGDMYWVLRGDFSPGFANELRQAIKEIDPRQRVARIRTLEAAVASSAADSRFDAWLFGLFAAVALALTAVGIHGMLSFSVARRKSEIGTRIALGVTPARVLQIVLQQGVRPLVFGLIASLAGALAVTRPLSSLLFDVRPTAYWGPYLAVPALVLAVGVLAGYLPAYRATKVDPLIALRSE